MEPLSADKVAKLLEEIGQRLELGGESPFKVKAYYVAAENLRGLQAPLQEFVAKGKVREIPGVDLARLPAAKRGEALQALNAAPAA